MLYRRVGHVLRPIVVAERGLELHAGRQQRRVRLLELLDEVAGLWPPYMLSPSMITRSNGNFDVCASSSAARLRTEAGRRCRCRQWPRTSRIRPVGQRHRLREQSCARGRGKDENETPSHPPHARDGRPERIAIAGCGLMPRHDPPATACLGLPLVRRADVSVSSSPRSSPTVCQPTPVRRK